MKNPPDNLCIKAQAGFSLVEIMVGMVIALLGIIIIFQVFSVSEGIKRTTTSGGDAIQNGGSALFSLQRSLKSAGYGFFSSTNVTPYPATPAGTAPMAITTGAGNASDSIAITYRPNWDYGAFAPASGVGFPSPPALTVETFSVNANAQLVSSVNGVISDGIVLMQAEYGTDTTVPPNGVVDTWTQTAPANVLSALAVRVVVVARSAQPEVTKTAAGLITTCATTTAAPTWIGSVVTANNPVAVPLDLSGNVGLAAGDSWQCYRYKTFENTVPLRNLM